MLLIRYISIIFILLLCSNLATQAQAYVRGTLWHDVNENQAVDWGEPFLPQMAVYLMDTNNEIIDTAYTGYAGNYIFALSQLDLTKDANYQVSFCAAPNPDCTLSGWSLVTENTFFSFQYAGDLDDILGEEGSTNWWEDFWNNILAGIEDFFNSLANFFDDLGNAFEGVFNGSVEIEDVDDLVSFLENLDSINFDFDATEYEIDFDSLFANVDSIFNHLDVSTIDTFNFGFQSLGISESVAVWPGDADNDGSVRITDLLRIGLGYGTEGTARSELEQGVEWRAYTGNTWLVNFLDSTDYVYADCNGDGTINDLDVEAIDANYHEMHGKTNHWPTETSTTNGANLSFDTDNFNYEAGDTARLPILLGSENTPLSALYGLSFSINYNRDLIQENSLQLSFEDSWLRGDENDNENQHILSLAKSNPTTGQMDVALTRTDQQDRQGGFGKIALFTFVLTDDLMRKDPGGIPIQLSFSNIIAVTNDSKPVAVQAETSQIVITNVETIDNPVVPIQIYPNPTSDRLFIEGVYEKMSLHNSLGQLVLQQDNYVKTINVHHLPNGFYVLNLWKNKQKYQTKIQILHHH